MQFKPESMKAMKESFNSEGSRYFE